MTLYFGSDHAGVELRKALADLARQAGHVVVDLGPKEASPPTDYPVQAFEVGRRVAAEEGAAGVLVCGTGVGMAIAANKVAGVRAAVVSDPFSARMSRAHNDANVLCVGARVVGPGLAAEILHAFLSTPFEGGRHARRLDLIRAEELGSTGSTGGDAGPEPGAPREGGVG